MAEATNEQMQTYADQRIRPRAEQARALIAAMRDDKLAIDDIYARAVGATPWDDNRTDGPPVLLNQQDVLTYNSIATLLVKCIDGTATLQDVADLNASWLPFQSACVRPLGS